MVVSVQPSTAKILLRVLLWLTKLQQYNSWNSSTSSCLWYSTEEIKTSSHPDSLRVKEKEEEKKKTTTTTTTTQLQKQVTLYLWKKKDIKAQLTVEKWDGTIKNTMTACEKMYWRRDTPLGVTMCPEDVNRWSLDHQRRDWEHPIGLSSSFCFHRPHLLNSWLHWVSTPPSEPPVEQRLRHQVEETSAYEADPS